MKLGQKYIQEHVHKFMELLRYVDYIKEERVKSQIFVRRFPSSDKDKIEFTYPQTLEVTTKMVMHCYYQSKGKVEVWPA